MELACTLLAFEVGRWIQRWLGSAVIANPVAIAVALIVALLSFTSRPIAEYTARVQVLPLLLDPATVALAVPLHAACRTYGSPLGRCSWALPKVS